MKEKIIKLMTATTDLIAYIEDNQVYDKMADCGCGYIDSYRTDKFEEVIRQAREAALEVKNELRKASN